MSWARRTMIVPTPLVELARALAETAAGPAGAGMWKTGLSADGALPATHFVSAGMIEQQFVGLLTDADALFAATAGVVPIEQCRALVAQSDVSDEPPFDAFSRLGLRLVQEPE